jgi:hypothetical protein
VEFISHSKWDNFEIILMGSDTLTPPQYWLSYKVKSSNNRPPELIRESNKRKFTIEAAAEYLETDDGNRHQIKWVRYKNGAIQVLMDNEVI